MLTKLRERAQDEKGFTLIELLVVILIIGILAAIALPAFLNQREKAQDSEAKSNVRTAQTAMETFFTDNQTYAAATVATLEGIEPALKNAKALSVTPNGTVGYTIAVTSRSNKANVFTIKNTSGVVERTCTTVNTGGCPSSGSW